MDEEDYEEEDEDGGEEQYDDDASEEDEATVEGEEDEEEEDAEPDDSEDIEKLQRVGRLADVNNDDMLSAMELQDFAQILRAKDWWEQTLRIHATTDLNGDEAVTFDELRSSGLHEATLQGDHLE